MYKLSCDITIVGSQTWSFKYVSDCTLLLDSGTLTDTCKLKLPKKVKWENSKQIPIRTGDKITVKLGYDDKLKTRFIGYITRIESGDFIEVEAQDSMYLLKNASVKQSCIEDGNIALLLAHILPAGIAFKIEGCAMLGRFRINEDTVIQTLDRLRDLGINVYFKIEDEKPILFCGVRALPQTSAPKPLFKEKVNIIESHLQSVSKEDRKVRIKATVLLKNNETISFEIGDPEGQLRSIFRYELSYQGLMEWAKQELQRLQFDGLTGSFTGFGVPEVDKGDILYLESEQVPSGAYLVSKVEVRFGTSGYRQTISLERRAL